MKQSEPNVKEPSTRLRQDLLDRIVRLIHDEALQPGARLNENRLAQDLGVSRTPIRAALDQLAAGGFVGRRPNRGVELIALPPPLDPPRSTDLEDELLVRIAHDHERQDLPVDISEAELMKRYGVSRQRVREALARLEELDIVERKAGYGWHFADLLRDESATQESYRFRILVEPAAILEPDFALRPGWAAEMRERHAAALAAARTGQWSASASIAFFETNAAFHEGIGAASGNRYLAHAIRRQSKLRRLSNYDWTYGRDRVEISCREHMEILDRLEAGDFEVAAALMRRHLHNASLV
ncbi:GntR family transcriptional regulator [Labrys neptuniae]